jgi:hypothetical protein
MCFTRSSMLSLHGSFTRTLRVAVDVEKLCPFSIAPQHKNFPSFFDLPQQLRPSSTKDWCHQDGRASEPEIYLLAWDRSFRSTILRGGRLFSALYVRTKRNLSGSGGSPAGDFNCPITKGCPGNKAMVRRTSRRKGKEGTFAHGTLYRCWLK